MKLLSAHAVCIIRKIRRIKRYNAWVTTPRGIAVAELHLHAGLGMQESNSRPSFGCLVASRSKILVTNFRLDIRLIGYLDDWRTNWNTAQAP